MEHLPTHEQPGYIESVSFSISADTPGPATQRSRAVYPPRPWEDAILSNVTLKHQNWAWPFCLVNDRHTKIYLFSALKRHM